MLKSSSAITKIMNDPLHHEAIYFVGHSIGGGTYRTWTVTFMDSPCERTISITICFFQILKHFIIHT